jgi:predicted SAM-dependent methyltransferase
MFHVLEHLPNPRFALEYAKGLLRPGGMLIIQVPNVSSLQARVFGRRWYGLDVPRHVINYTPKALSLLLEEMGFSFHVRTRRFIKVTLFKGNLERYIIDDVVGIRIGKDDGGI